MKKIIKITLVLTGMLSLSETKAQLKIGDNVSTIQPGSLLELESTTKGVLLPRLTSLQRDAISASFEFSSTISQGLTIYNTTQGCINFWVHNNGDGHWASACEQGWGLLGNSGTNSGVNFLGTKDLKSLRFRTNNLERMVIDSNGNIGIGTSSPFHKITAITNINTSTVGLGNMDGYRFTGLVSPNVNLTGGHPDAQNPFHVIGEIPSTSVHDVSTVRAFFSQAINNGSQNNIIGNLEGVVGEARNNVNKNITQSINGGFFGSWNTAGTVYYQNGMYAYANVSPAASITRLSGVRIFMENLGTATSRYGIQIEANGNQGVLRDYGISVIGFKNPLYLENLKQAENNDSLLTVSGGIVKKKAANVSPILVTSTNVSLDASHSTVVLKTGVTLVTLPTASAHQGRAYIIANSSSNPCFISSYNSLSGNTSSGINSNSSITIQSDGIGWYQIR